MDGLEAQLQQLVTETCQHPKGSSARQKGLHKIIILIQQSGKLLKDRSVPDAEDALQQTWLYFCSNLCEATTAKESYNCQKGCLIAWLNSYLKYRLKDKVINSKDAKRVYPFLNKNGEEIDPLDFIPTPQEPPPILRDIQEWLKQEADELRRLYLRDRPDINCLVLIERRLPPETSWGDLSQEFGVSVSTLSSFYQRHCFPRLLRFGKAQGYFDN